MEQDNWGNLIHFPNQHPILILPTNFLAIFFMHTISIIWLYIFFPILILYNQGQHHEHFSNIFSKLLACLNTPALYIFSAFSFLQFLLMLSILLHNPGYQLPVTTKPKPQCFQLSKEKSAGSKVEERNSCALCRRFIHATTIHCQSCDLCCNNHNHHCIYFNKCVSSFSAVALRLYFLNYGLGIMGICLFRMLV